MKEPANDCNLTYPIFNISSLNSKMTQYDPNTVPIMQHWSKWPFHTKEWKKNQSNTSSSFFILPSSSLHTKVPLTVGTAGAYVYIIHIKQNAARQIKWPQHRKQFLRGHTSDSFVHKRVVFPFVFVCFCLPLVYPPAPPPRTSPPRLVCCETPSHVKSQKPRQVTKTGPDFSAHQSKQQARSHHNG